MVNETTKINAKQKILLALKEMFLLNRLDYKDITIAGLCRKAGITRKTFYRYFSSKEEAGKYLVQSQIDYACKEYDGIINSQEPFVEKMKTVQKYLYKSYNEEFTSDFIKRMNIDAPEIINEHNKRIEKLYSRIRVLIEQGVKEGKVRENLEPDCIVALLYTTAVSLNNYSFLVENKYDTDFIIRQAFDIVLNGILKRND